VTDRADLDRAAVYAAELAAFDGTCYETITEFTDLAAITAQVVGESWWPAGPVEVRLARRDAGSSSASAQTDARPVIRLAAPQMTQATVVHELAHVLAGVGSGHGPVFRRAHCDLVAHVFGDEAAGWLLDAYCAMGLDVGDRAWPQPGAKPGCGGAIALSSGSVHSASA
jgi:putative metallohydrolase (TIGR04338 family)